MDKDLWKIIYKKGKIIEKLKGVFRGYLRRIKDIFRLRKFDIIYIHMWVTPLGSTLFERIFVIT